MISRSHPTDRPTDRPTTTTTTRSLRFRKGSILVVVVGGGCGGGGDASSAAAVRSLVAKVTQVARGTALEFFDHPLSSTRSALATSVPPPPLFLSYPFLETCLIAPPFRSWNLPVSSSFTNFQGECIISGSFEIPFHSRSRRLSYFDKNYSSNELKLYTSFARKIAAR